MGEKILKCSNESVGFVYLTIDMVDKGKFGVKDDSYVFLG